MRTEKVTVYKFNELSDATKERARNWYRNLGIDNICDDESMESIKAFCDRFGTRLIEFDLDHLWFRSTATQETFRGVKLRRFNRDHMPTGYCMDADLWQTFYDTFKATGDARRAYDDAIYAGLRAWRDDREHQNSDEYIDEMLTINEYEFTEDGEFFC